MTVWSNLGYAGAFVAGTIVGAVAVARVTRAAMDYLREERRK